MFSKIVPTYRGLLRGIFEAKNAEMVLGQHGEPVGCDEHTLHCPNQGTIVTFGGGEVCDVRTGFL